MLSKLKRKHTLPIIIPVTDNIIQMQSVSLDRVKIKPNEEGIYDRCCFKMALTQLSTSSNFYPGCTRFGSKTLSLLIKLEVLMVSNEGDERFVPLWKLVSTTTCGTHMCQRWPVCICPLFVLEAGIRG